MSDSYPNESANTIYTHLRSLSNTISDFGESITFLHLYTTLSPQLDPTMPSFNHSGSIRRRFLRLISFGRYSSGSTDDLEPLTKAHDGSRRHSAPADLEEQSSRPIYTAHQSPQSSESAQTTIVHEVSAGKAPFSISGLRDQYRGRVISDAEFDTPPSLEAARETIRPAEPKRIMGPRHGFPRTTANGHYTEALPAAGATPWPADRDPIHFRRDKSFLRCNVCSRVLEYNQIHCPGCAARTLHHVPVAKENSDPDHRDNIAGSKPLRPKKQRQPEQPDVATEESSWDTQGLEAGTVEESWTTTTNDAVETASPSAKHTQEASSQSTETQEQSHSRCCCCCGSEIVLINHCCCNASTTHAAAAIAFVGPTSNSSRTRKFWKRCMLPRRFVRCLARDAEYINIIEGEVVKGCVCAEGNQKVSRKKASWWTRWSRWFCCC